MKAYVDIARERRAFRRSKVFREKYGAVVHFLANQQHIGRRFLGKRLSTMFGLDKGGANLRQIVEEARRRGKPICSSTSQGYWWEPDYEAFCDNLDKELGDRMIAMGYTISRGKANAKKDFAPTLWSRANLKAIREAA